MKSLNSQKKISADMMARWITFLQKFSFSMKHKFGVKNKVANALSRRVALLITFHSEILGFECLKELYTEDVNFRRYGRSVLMVELMKISVYMMIT